MKCNPQILATCSSIHKEASSILYGADILNVEVQRIASSHPHFRGNYHYVISMQPHLSWPDYGNAERVDLRTRGQDSSIAIQRFEKMRLRITFAVTSSRIMDGEQISSSKRYKVFISAIQYSTALKSVEITGDTRKGGSLVAESDLLTELYPLSRLYARTTCRLDGFNEYPNLIESIRCIADQNKYLFKVNIGEKLSFILEESDAYKELSDVTSNPKNRQRHVKLRNNMPRVFYLAPSNLEVEKDILERVDQMAAFLNTAHEDEARKSISHASGFWLELLRAFDEAHKARMAEFPE